MTLYGDLLSYWVPVSTLRTQGIVQSPNTTSLFTIGPKIRNLYINTEAGSAFTGETKLGGLEL